MSFLDQPWSPTSVQVTVLQARGLRAKGKGGTNDAYALMQVGKDKYQTSVVEKSVAPVWKEEAAFELPQQGAAGGRGTLHVHVLHRALVGLDKLLGQAVIDLQLLAQDKNRSKSEWFKLLDKNGKADKDRGEVLVDIQFMKNNMTASMFDLSAVGKSRSRLGKLKDKVRGKKKEPDPASPSITQVLTESEEEDELDEGKAPMSKEKKRLKIKSIFSHKSNLQRNLSQSMTVLPDKNSALSGSLSSGLNVDTAEGKKKFRFLKHKHSDSSDPKGSSQKHAALEKSNLCINGSHVYCEEPPLRVSRVGSNFSLASSGLGSMEDVPENSPPPVDLLPVIRQYTPWEEEEEEEDEQEKTEVDGLTDIQERTEEHTLKRLEEEQEKEESQENARKQELEGVEKQEEEEEEEDETLRTQELQRLEEERMRLDEEKEREDELTRQKERELNEEAERLRNLELERLEAEKWRREEKKRRDEERARQEEEEQERLAMEKRLEEEKRREEERARQEEEEQERLAMEKRLEEEKRRDEERARMEEEDEQKRLALEDEKRRDEERARQEEEEQERKREEQERLALEKRLEEEERKREEAEQTRRLALERLEAEKVRLAEEEKSRQDEEEQLALVKRREEEEEKKRQEAERLRRHEVERLEVEKKRQEKEEERRRAEEKQRLAEEQQRLQQLELERLKKEKMRLEEEKRRVEEQARKKEEERVRRREEQKRFEEEQRRLEEEEERRRNEEKEEEERERMAEEERKMEEEKRRKEEEEQLRKEEQEMKRQEAQVAEEKRKMEEKAQEAKMNEEKKESETREHVEKEEDRRIDDDDDDDDDDVRKEEVPKKLKDDDKMDEACEEKSNQKAKTVLQDTQMDSSNPFDEGLTNNPFDDDLPNPFFRSKNRTSDQTFPKSCASSEASLGSNNTATDKKNTPLNQREKRAAPQPPGKTRSNIPADPTVPSKPTMEPLKDIQSKNASPATSPEQKDVPPKPAKRLAPSIPSADSKPVPATHTLNPFDDDDDGGKEQATQDPGFVSRAPPVSQIPNPNAASQSKVKSMKVARAPVPPAKSAVVASRPPTLQSGGVEIQASVAGKVLESQENLSKESKPKKLQNGQGAGEKKDPPPAPARRLQPVKPLSQEPHPPTETQDEKGISPLGNSEKTVRVNKEKGPYSMLTREELISLVEKQEKQLQNKDKRIAELEQYIDNLLLRVMEEQPSILMSMKKLV